MNLPSQTRTRVKPDHALLAPDSFVRAPLPGWANSQCIVHISPELGARFKMFTVEMEMGAVAEAVKSGLERFVWIIDGEVSVDGQNLKAHEYAYFPSGDNSNLTAKFAARVMVIERVMSLLEGSEPPQKIVAGANQISPRALSDDPGVQVQTLLPDNLSFGLAVNIMNFDPGAQLPFVETHVMEHGLLMLEGQGIYRFNDCWYPVQAGDVVWMASFCPQWFGALGKTKARYLIYKDVNRHSLGDFR